MPDRQPNPADDFDPDEIPVARWWRLPDFREPRWQRRGLIAVWLLLAIYPVLVLPALISLVVRGAPVPYAVVPLSIIGTIVTMITIDWQIDRHATDSGVKTHLMVQIIFVMLVAFPAAFGAIAMLLERQF